MQYTIWEHLIELTLADDTKFRFKHRSNFEHFTKVLGYDFPLALIGSDVVRYPTTHIRRVTLLETRGVPSDKPVRS